MKKYKKKKVNKIMKLMATNVPLMSLYLRGD